MKANTNRKVLDGLPMRDWNMTSTYESLLVVPSGKKHDSGYHLMAIVGVRGGQPVEIAAYCDDIEVHVPEGDEVIGGSYSLATFRVDMSYPSGIANWWGASFEVGLCLSTTSVTIRHSKK